MIGDVLVFEGQGARSLPGDPPIELGDLSPADAQRAIVAYQLDVATSKLTELDASAAATGSRRVTSSAGSFAVLGQSLGEISALVVAGALGRSDAFEIVRLRAELPAKVLRPRRWSMASMTRLPPERAESAADGLAVWVIGHNAPTDCIVVGDADDFDVFVDRLGASPNTFRMLPVTAPYHTPAMQPVADEIAASVESFAVADPSVDVLSPTTGGLVATAADARAVLVEALTRPVRWSSTLVAAAERWRGARWWECGPSFSLHRFVWKNDLQLDWEPAAGGS